MRVLITGADGFAGRAVASAFRGRGDALRVALGPGAKPGARERLEALGAELAVIDLADEDSIARAARGCEVVVHAAERAQGEGTPADHERDNLVGTENVLAACDGAGVRRLVFVSSEAVTLGNYPRDYVDESFPQPDAFLDAYSRTKALAEDLVLGANKPAAMTTVALRPGWLWGPGDDVLLPALVRRRRAKSLALVDGGRALVPTAYASNFADAVLLAAGADAAAGNAYYVTDDERISCKAFYAKLLVAAGLDGPRKSAPYALAYAAAWWADRRDPAGGARVDVVRRGRQALFNVKRARDDLAWAPAVSVAQGMQKLAAWARAVGGPDAIAKGALLDGPEAAPAGPAPGP